MLIWGPKASWRGSVEELIASGARAARPGAGASPSDLPGTWAAAASQGARAGRRGEWAARPLAWVRSSAWRGRATVQRARHTLRKAARPTASGGRTQPAPARTASRSPEDAPRPGPPSARPRRAAAPAPGQLIAQPQAPAPGGLLGRGRGGTGAPCPRRPRSPGIESGLGRQTSTLQCLPLRHRAGFPPPELQYLPFLL